MERKNASGKTLAEKEKVAQKFRQARIQGFEKEDQNKSRRCSRQIGGRARKGNPQVVTSRVPQVVRVDGNGFGPAEDRGPDDRENDGKENGAEGVDVDDGIQRSPPQAPGRRVSELVSRPGVRRFVDGDGEEQHKQADDDRYDIHDERV